MSIEFLNEIDLEQKRQQDLVKQLADSAMVVEITGMIAAQDEKINQAIVELSTMIAMGGMSGV